ncbi:MAG: hypothetical protein IJ298_02680 [Ruminococcus sp.]|nr:hypothetical protein [Ruminococcus sp.]
MDGFSPVAIADGEAQIEGVYIGDLLSWVMGRANAGDAWITIMSNINILAVATLSDVACIILAEGVQLEEEVKTAAQQKGINVISSDMSAYHIAAALSKAL